MTTYVDVAIPFETHGNKRVLTCKQLAEEPWLQEFVNAFPDCFEPDEGMAWLVFTPPEDEHGLGP